MPVKHLHISLILWSTTLPHMLMLILTTATVQQKLMKKLILFLLNLQERGWGGVGTYRRKAALLPSLPDTQRLVHPFKSTVLSPFGKCLPVVM